MGLKIAISGMWRSKKARKAIPPTRIRPGTMAMRPRPEVESTIIVGVAVEVLSNLITEGS